MMPQKKNPDVFELVRGKSGRAVGNLVSLLVTVKGLPGGYNRDLQEDRSTLLETAPMLHGTLGVLRLALPRVTFDKKKCRSGLDEGFTQATDLAEALVKKGMPFRVAYQKIGSLVRRCQERNISLSDVSVEMAAEVDAAIDFDVLKVIDPRSAVERKVSAGSTGPGAVAQQLEVLEAQARVWVQKGQKVPRLEELMVEIQKIVI